MGAIKTEADDDGSRELEQLTPNQRRAHDRALAALEAMATTWAAEINLRAVASKIAAFPGGVRAERTAAMIEQAFIEGAYRHFIDHEAGRTPCAWRDAADATSHG